MKELKLLGVDGVVIWKGMVNLTGPDVAVDFDLPIYVPLVSVSLTEKKEKIISLEVVCGVENPCCDRRGEYNGFASGPLSFVCPKHCSCHD